MDTKESPEDLSTDDPEPNDWIQMTSEILRKSTEKLPPSRNLIVLGDDEVDRSSVVQRLCGKAASGPTGAPRCGSAMEYNFISVRDEYCEDQTKMNIWSLDEDAVRRGLLRFVLNEQSFKDATVVLAVSMTRPWEMMDRLKTWTFVLEKHVRELGIEAGVLQSQKDELAKRFREYVEPGFHVPGIAEAGEELMNGSALDVIVVVVKTEYINTLVSDMGYENEHFDFIQLHLRRFCLARGASLIYMSVKEDRNCDLFLRYILHRIYSFSFRTPALLVERDSIFVPSGYDSANKIDILSNTLMTINPNAPFQMIISQPSRLFVSQGLTDALPPTDQDFLGKLQMILSQPMAEGQTDVAPDVPRSSPVLVQRARRSPIKRLEPRSQSAEGDTVLHTFFQSLLNRKTSIPGSGKDDVTGISGELDSDKDPAVPHSFPRIHTLLSRKTSAPTGHRGEPADEVTTEPSSDVVHSERNSSNDRIGDLLSRKIAAGSSAKYLDNPLLKGPTGDKPTHLPLQRTNQVASRDHSDIEGTRLPRPDSDLGPKLTSGLADGHRSNGLGPTDLPCCHSNGDADSRISNLIKGRLCKDPEDTKGHGCEGETGGPKSDKDQTMTS